MPETEAVLQPPSPPSPHPFCRRAQTRTWLGCMPTTMGPKRFRAAAMKGWPAKPPTPMPGTMPGMAACKGLLVAATAAAVAAGTLPGCTAAAGLGPIDPRPRAVAGPGPLLATLLCGPVAVTAPRPS
eukprot:scaffold160633_cov14-Tisochrysis_lutea.AAC.1